MKLSKYITPFVLLSLFTIIRIIYLIATDGGAKGWGYLGAMFLTVALIIMLVTDLILQVVFSSKKQVTWIIEIVMVIAAWIFFTMNNK
jgi:hypothetical protein